MKGKTMKVKVEVEVHEIRCRSCYKLLGFGFSASVPNLKLFCERCVKEKNLIYGKRERRKNQVGRYSG
jgi:phage FluMu protein Com